jgi:DMSO/TMAO reductase YedYZ heme-binding membrane subunit
VNGQLWWHLARASGIVAWLSLTASVLWGIFLSTRILQQRRRPAWLLDLHRGLGALTIGFVAIHLGALVADNFLHFGLGDLVVPFASNWRPGAVALGVVAAWILAVVEISSLALKHLPRRAWRAIHLTSYLAFWLTSIHAALAGTDTTNPLYRWASAVTILAIVFAVAYRVLTRGRPPPGRESGSAPRAVAHGGDQVTATSSSSPTP